MHALIPLVEVARAAARVERNLRRVYGRELRGHDLPTYSAVIALREALAKMPAAELDAELDAELAADDGSRG
jgi:RNase P protein component